MVLPEGATRQEISRTATRVFDYVRDNAVRWARYFAQTRGQTTANGSTYFITGVDKTSICSNLAFPNLPPTVKMSARYQDQLIRASERMSSVNNASNIRHNRALSPIPKNLCVFMRGIRIGLGRTEWIENTDERPEDDTPYSEIFFDTPRLTFFKIRIWGKDEQAVAQNDKSFFALVNPDFIICAKQHFLIPMLACIPPIRYCCTDNALHGEWILPLSKAFALDFLSGSRQCNCGSGG